MKYLKSLIVVVIGFFLLGTQRSAQRVRSEDGDFAGNGSKAASDDQDADSPADLSKTGWKKVFKRTKQALKDKQLSTQAAGLAYYTTLAFFPALLGAATVYATFAGPQALLDVIDGLAKVIPPAIHDVIDQQLSPLAQAKPGTLGIAAVVSVIALLWTTSGGLQNLIKATNVAYDVSESRGLVKLRLLSVALSGVLLLIGVIILLLLLMQRDGLYALGFPSGVSESFPYLRWPLLIALISVLLAVIYRYAPNRQVPHWSWVSWGAVAATVIWLIGTALFFFYAQNFGNFNKTYGIFAGIIILMTWFNLTSLIILVGAQVNKKLEEVSDVDTTQ